MSAMTIADAVESLKRHGTEVIWSIDIVDAAGRHLGLLNPGRVCQTASVGKVLLLIEAANQIDEGRLSRVRSTSKNFRPCSA